MSASPHGREETTCRASLKLAFDLARSVEQLHPLGTNSGFERPEQMLEPLELGIGIRMGTKDKLPKIRRKTADSLPEVWSGLVALKGMHIPQPNGLT